METPSTPTTVSTDSQPSSFGGIEALRPKAGPVRRNLFGPVDHQQLQDDFQRLLRLSVEVANKRWNYDFQHDRPQQAEDNNDIEWEELRSPEVPMFYRSCSTRPLVKQTRVGKSKASHWTLSFCEDSAASSSSSGSGDEYMEISTRTFHQIQRAVKRRQATIPDFFKVKKRKLFHHKASSRL